MKTLWKNPAFIIMAAILNLAGNSSTANADTTSQSAAVAPDQSSANWVSRVSFGGDIRLRADYVNTANDVNTSEALRARLVTDAKVNDKLTAKFRLTTGPSDDDPASSDAAFGNGNSKRTTYFDVTSVDYALTSNSTLGAGKTLNPFFMAGQNDLIWDPDVTFEGANFRYQRNVGNWRPFANLAHVMLQDVPASSNDVTMLGAQIGSGFTSENLSATLALASYAYSNVNGLAYFYGARGNSGVSTYDTDYRMTNLELEIGTKIHDNPFVAYGSYVTNPAASDYKTGYLVGLRLGEAKTLGTWLFDWSYRNLQKDATIGAFTSDKFAGGGTDVSGHRVVVKRAVADNTAVMLTGIFSNRLISADPVYYNRWMLDLLASF